MLPNTARRFTRTSTDNTSIATQRRFLAIPTDTSRPMLPCMSRPINMSRSNTLYCLLMATLSQSTATRRLGSYLCARKKRLFPKLLRQVHRPRRSPQHRNLPSQRRSIRAQPCPLPRRHNLSKLNQSYTTEGMRMTVSLLALVSATFEPRSRRPASDVGCPLVPNSRNGHDPDRPQTHPGQCDTGRRY